VRKRRTWEFIVDVSRHPVTGRRHQKSKGSFATKREAESALHELIHSMDGGADPSPERIALADYLARWLDYQRSRRCDPSGVGARVRSGRRTPANTTGSR